MQPRKTLLETILSWDVEWLWLYSDADSETPPPGVTGQMAQGSIARSYCDAGRHRDAYLHLAIQEIWAQFLQEWECEAKIGVGYVSLITMCPIHLETAMKKKPGIERFGCIIKFTVMDHAGDRNLWPCVGELVIITPIPLDGTGITSQNKLSIGYVVYEAENDSGSYWIQMIKNNQESYPPGVNVLVKPVYYLRPMYRQLKAVIHLGKSPLASAILDPLPHRTFRMPRGRVDDFNRLDIFNVMQRQAILGVKRTILAADRSRIHLIQGPPGTGKTTALIAMLKEIYQADGYTKPILICAPSNGAADAIAAGLYDAREQFGQTLTVVRAGKTESQDPRVLALTLGNITNNQEEGNVHLTKNSQRKMGRITAKLVKLRFARGQHNMRRVRDLNDQLLKYRSRVRYMRRKKFRFSDEDFAIVSRAHIVVTTLNSSRSFILSSTFGQAGERKFSAIIVDEAGQCSEPETLVPLYYNANKLILIGDPCQLPPTIISRYAGNKKYDQSLFERIQKQFNIFELAGKPNPVLMLTTQYRMHPQICSFPSAQFYGGRVKTYRDIQRHSPLPPYLVIDLKGSTELIDWSKSKCNVMEANFVKLLIHAIRLMLPRSSDHNDNVSKLETLGVITPYWGQVEMINEKIAGIHARMRESHGIKLNVDTVDGFQGQERDIIILSCVRAPKKDVQVIPVSDGVARTVGFMSCKNRLNVALTRAKYCQLVVLNSQKFKVDPMWSDLICDASTRGKLVEVDASQLLQVEDKVNFVKDLLERFSE